MSRSRRARVASHLGTEHRSVDLSVGDAIDADPAPRRRVGRTVRRPLDVAVDVALPSCQARTFGLHRRRRRRRTLRRIQPPCLWSNDREADALGAAACSLGGRSVRCSAPSPATLDRAMKSVARVLPGGRRLPNMGDKIQKLGGLLAAGGAPWAQLAGVWPTDDLGVAPLAPSVPSLVVPIGDVEQMMLTDTASVLPDQMMVKVDRASMASSLEVRAPLLDHRLLEWSWRQPLAVKTNRGVGKLVLRNLASSVLPSDLARRPKMGFDPPLGSVAADRASAVGPRPVDRLADGRTWLARRRVVAPHMARARGRQPQLGVSAVECLDARIVAPALPPVTRAHRVVNLVGMRDWPGERPQGSRYGSHVREPLHPAGQKVTSGGC